MRKLILPALFIMAFLGACTFSKTKMAKVKKLAVVSMFCAKQVDNSGAFMFDVVEMATKDSLKLDTFANRIKDRVFTDLFAGSKFSLINPDTITHNPLYSSLSKSNYSTFSFFGFASPNGYRAVNSLDPSNFPKLRKMYPDADAFAFIRVNYYFEKRTGGNNLLLSVVGLASIQCTYEVIIYNKDGEKISYDETLTYSDLFPFLFSSTLSPHTVKYIDQADKSSYARMSKRMKRHWASLESKME